MAALTAAAPVVAMVGAAAEPRNRFRRWMLLQPTTAVAMVVTSAMVATAGSTRLGNDPSACVGPTRKLFKVETHQVGLLGDVERCFRGSDSVRLANVPVVTKSTAHCVTKSWPRRCTGVVGHSQTS